ncbi:MAG TPA: hypothetical protein VGC76_04060 [Pyrinomonadaceae bacterium]|jgi:hypothetical protein
MKLFSAAICLLFLTSFLTLPVFAQKVETEGELFNQISALTKTKKADDQEKAYQLGKDFISKFGKNNDDEVKKVREFMETYEIAFVGRKIDEGKTAEAFTFGKEVMTQEPDNAHLAMTLAYAGYLALVNKKDKSLGQDSIQFAQKALQLLNDKKLPSNFQPFTDQDDATAMMYYTIATFSVDSNLSDAAQNFYKSLQYNTKVKNNSYPYYIIAFNYEKQYEKAAKDFDAKYGAATTSTAEMRTAEASLEKLLGNMQDAYARAVKLGEAENAPKVNEWKQRYAQIYSFIKGSDAGSAEFLANVLATPMPAP